jgi:hypothetical protein
VSALLTIYSRAKCEPVGDVHRNEGASTRSRAIGDFALKAAFSAGDEHPVKWSGVLGTVLATTLGTVLAVTLASCVAPIKIERSADPLSLLGPNALAYLRLDGDSARQFAPAILPPSQSKALSPLMERTTSLALALGPHMEVTGTRSEVTDTTATAQAGTGKAGNTTGATGKEVFPSGTRPAQAENGMQSFEAVLLGRYPFRAASLGIGIDRAWKPEKGSLYNAAAGIRAALPGPNTVVASTGDIGPMLERLKAPGISPLPSRLQTIAGREILVWIPDPMRGLTSLFGEPMDLPIRGLLLAVERRKVLPSGQVGGEPGNSAAANESSYSVTAAFLMKDASSARIYRPALRIAWYVLARALFGNDTESALGTRFDLDGELYWASGIALKSSSLRNAFARLGKGIAKR